VTAATTDEHPAAGARKAVFAATPAQATAIATAIAVVASAGGRDPLSSLGAGTAQAASRYVLGQPAAAAALTEGTVVPSTAPSTAAADELASLVSDPWEAEVTARLLAVAALADGTFDGTKVDRLLGYADALGVTGDYLHQIELGTAGDAAEMGRDMMRENLRSIPGIGWDEQWSPADVERALAPYVGAAADPALATSYERLADCPPGSLGRSFFDFYDRYGFSFPGDAGALNEHFATRHDATHLLSGYNTSLQGELLVSTFTATMHEVNAMSGHIVPVIVSWHVGTQVNEVARHATGAYDPEKFFVAWARGAATTTDTFDPGWSLWDHANGDIDELRADYGIGPLDRRFASTMPVPAKGDVHRPAGGDRPEAQGN
jgi:hypothetical protein